jgi:uncharacterized membrane protein YbhN (UPF0104 family)
MSSSATAYPVVDSRVTSGQEGGDSAVRVGRRKLLIHAGFGVVGAGALFLLVRGVGPETLLAILGALARWLPLLFALDVLRVVAEAVGTWSLSERVRRRVPLAELARIHLVGYAIAMTMPAGRAAGEAVKAAMLARFIGLPEAAAVGAVNQSTSMLGGVLGAIPCVVAALWLTGLSPLTGAFAAFVLVTLVGFTALQVACRQRGLGGALLHRFTRLEQATTAFHEAIARIPVVPPVATVAAVVSRLVVVVELAVLLFALGGRHGVGAALLAQGVSLVGGTVGDFVPGQLGATDGAFALAAPYLGVALASGVAISVMLHCVQATWAVIGWTAPLFWKPSPLAQATRATETSALPRREPVSP